MASISASTPIKGSGFSDFCLSVPARSPATVTTGVISVPLFFLFLLPFQADLPVACCARGAVGGRKAKGSAFAGGSGAGGGDGTAPPPPPPDL